VDPGSDEYLLSLECLIYAGEGQPFPAGLEGGLNERIISELLGFIIHESDFLRSLHAVKIMMS
jgi:hypothetical protein